MARTKLADHLLHRPVKFRQDAQRLDSLCGLARHIAIPVVRQALVRETAQTGAEAWMEEVQIALKGVVELHPDKFGHALENLKSALASGLRNVPSLSDKEVAEHAHDLSRLMMSSWLEILRLSLSDGQRLVLTERLLPEEKWPASWEIMKETVSSFAVNEDDATVIMKGLRHKLVLANEPVELPFNIVLLQRSGQPIFATSARWEDLENPEPALASPA